MISKRMRILGVLLCLAVAPLARAEPHSAAWKMQDVRFVYRGTLTIYDCEILGSKVRQILDAVGAHESTRVQTESCNVLQPTGGAPAQVVSMRIHLTAPALATAELAAEQASAAARNELLKRLGAQPLALDEFPAAWIERDLSNMRGLKITAGDCELLRQVHEQLLSRLAVRVLRSDRSCSSSPHRLRRPVLKVLALMPLPHADAITQLIRKRT